MALPKKNRLRERSDFRDLKSKGKSFDTPLFKVFFLKSNSESQSCFGFIISKKVSLLAVKRNRLKRLFSEPILTNLPRIDQGYRVLFLAKRSCLKNEREIFHLVLETLKTLRVLSND
jgi:ribonuclease P protein component